MRSLTASPSWGGSCPAADPLLGLHISQQAQRPLLPLVLPHELSHSHCHFFFAEAAPQSHPRYLNPLLWVWLSLSSLESSDFPQALAPLASLEGLGVFIVPVPWKSQI